MAVNLGLPEGPGGEPVVVVPVEHQGGVVVDAGLRHQLFELRFRKNVANHRVAELGVPGPGDRAGHVAFVVSFRVDVDFHHAHVGIVGVTGHPIRTHQYFRMCVAPIYTLQAFNFSSRKISAQARSNFSWCSKDRLLPAPDGAGLPPAPPDICSDWISGTCATSGCTRRMASLSSPADAILCASCRISPTMVGTLLTYPAPSQCGQGMHSARSRLCFTRLRVIATKPKSLN